MKKYHSAKSMGDAQIHLSKVADEAGICGDRLRSHIVQSQNLLNRKSSYTLVTKVLNTTSNYLHELTVK